jgi:hypothetical protein
MKTQTGDAQYINKKFWEELIHLLPYVSHLFEVPEPNFMEFNLSELSIQFNLTELTAVKNWLPWLPWNMNKSNQQFSKAYLTTLNLDNFKIIEAIRLKLLYPGSLEWHYLAV